VRLRPIQVIARPGGAIITRWTPIYPCPLLHTSTAYHRIPSRRAMGCGMPPVAEQLER
jgi:hypothetical protein